MWDTLALKTIEFLGKELQQGFFFFTANFPYIPNFSPGEICMYVNHAKVKVLGFKTLQANKKDLELVQRCPQ